MEHIKRISRKALRVSKRFAHGMVKLEHPFHLAYLGAGTYYYATHEVLTVAFGSGGLFVIVLLSYLDKE